MSGTVLTDAAHRTRLVAGALYALAVVVIALIAAWPLYRTAALLLVAGVAVVVAAAIAVVAHRRRWGGWLVAGVLAGAFLVVGVPLAVPSRLGGPLDLLRGVGELASGLVFAWKDLLTVDLPVGDYRNLLVPALVVFLAGTCAVLLLAWRADRVAYAAVPVGLAMIGFGLFFGRTDVSPTLPIGPVTLHAPVETAIGVAGLLASLLWLAWRAHDERVRALQRAADSSGVRVSRRQSPADRRRTALGAGMIAAALVVAVAVVPAAASDAQRSVLRTAVGPEVDLSAAVSPLSQYRALFAGDRADEVLFTVSAEGVRPQRIRLATLDAYDGEVFRAGGGTVDGSRFVRVPAALDAGEGAPVDVTITIEGLDGIWMPTAGRLASVRFAGARAASLSDGFYYSAGASAGVQTAGRGLVTGDSYRVEGVEPTVVALEAAAAPGRTGEGVAAPENLRTWIEQHAVGTDGAALAGLVDLLRERGYLSHGLTDGPAAEAWMTALDDYRFQPSASGHSLARIDAMFERMLEREVDPRAEASGNYVAAVGDDEQFATAVALIARELGFPSRVVMGARLGDAGAGLPTCDDGACRGRDIAAWAEVLSSEGQWIAVDATPQYAQSPSLDVTEQRDPEIVTEVRPDAVEQILPPDPAQEDSTGDEGLPDDGGLDLAWLWPVLRISLLVVLALVLLVGPFLAVIAVKAARRRRRRHAPTPTERIVGGWEEYADAAADAGRATPRTLTRSELAASFDTAEGAALAVTADRAAFGGSDAGVTGADADAFWRTVDVERRSLTRDGGLWRRVLATVSLKSFVRQLAPSPGARTIAERGRRRTLAPVRPTP